MNTEPTRCKTGPAAHRIVPVELLESAAIAIISPYIKRELQAIIAKENT
jgi:hypothetical protein